LPRRPFSRQLDPPASELLLIVAAFFQLESRAEEELLKLSEITFGHLGELTGATISVPPI
jgi:hypothetical protein